MADDFAREQRFDAIRRLRSRIGQLRAMTRDPATRAKMDEVTLRLDNASAALQTAKVGESARLQMTDEHLALARQTVELLEQAM